MFISAQPPIYGVKVGSDRKEYIQPGANQEAELAALGTLFRRSSSNRPSNYKGLGEMDDHHQETTRIQNTA